jgi:UDP-glucuronate 4-epimerase
MKILITGTAGFIGFHLAKRWLDEGHEVIGVDNINDYYDVSLKYVRLLKTGVEREKIEYGKPVQSKTHEKYHFVKINLEDAVALEKLFADEGFDTVVNLAAQAGVRYSILNPHAYIQSNIVGFTNLLESCRRYPVRHLVYASSSSVYGNDAPAPFLESTKTDSPVSLYAATKKSNELMAYSYSHLYEIAATGLRFFTVYGPYGRPDMAPMLFADAISNKKPIKVFNNGNLSRDFTYIDDIVEGIFRVMRKMPVATPPHTIYNIGCSQPVQLMDFIRTLEEAIGKKAILEMYPMQPGDVYQTYADTSALMRDFGYSPNVSLREGIDRFVKWYKNN